MTDHPSIRATISTSPTIAAIATAMALASGKFAPIVKDRTAKVEGREGKRSYEYNFADLASTIDAVRPALSSEGLAVICSPITCDNGLEVFARLIHASGEWIEIGPLYFGCSQRPQDVGSAITYARRYLMQALLGLAAEDDDGSSAQASEPAPAPRVASSRRVVAPEPAPAPAPRKTTTLGMVPASDLAELDAAITRIAAAWEQSKGDAWRTLLGRADLPALKAPANLSPATYKLVRAEADSALAELDGFDADAREIAADLDGPPESADLVRAVEAVREAFPGTTEVGKPAKARRSKGGES